MVVVVVVVVGGGSAEDDGDSDEAGGAGGAGGSELAMLSRRNLPNWSRKSLSLPVVLVMVVEEEGGLNRRPLYKRSESMERVWSRVSMQFWSSSSMVSVQRERERKRNAEEEEEGWLAAQIGSFLFGRA